MNLSFIISILISIISILGILLGDAKTIEIPKIFMILTWIISVIFFSLMIYSLFIELPFKKIYTQTNNEIKLIDTGLYALCRHPGVILFFFLNIFLGLASGKVTFFWAAAIWTILNIVYVYIQDRWLFPIFIPGYEKYCQQVPFLIPNKTSYKNCKETIFRIK